MKLWKRNAVVAAIVLFVCVAVYLNWSYDQSSSVNGTNSITNTTSERTSGKRRWSTQTAPWSWRTAVRNRTLRPPGRKKTRRHPEPLISSPPMITLLRPD